MTWIHFTASRTDTPKKSNTQASMGENMKLFTGRNFERSGVQKRRRRSSIKGLGRKLLHSHKQARTQLFSSPAKDLTDTIWRSIFCIICIKWLNLKNWKNDVDQHCVLRLFDLMVFACTTSRPTVSIKCKVPCTELYAKLFRIIGYTMPTLS